MRYRCKSIYISIKNSSISENRENLNYNGREFLSVGHWWHEFSKTGERSCAYMGLAGSGGTVLLKDSQRHLSSTDLSTIFRNYARALGYYARIRSQVYIFAWVTLISVLISTNLNPDPFVALKVVLAIYFVALGTYIYNDTTDIKADRINSSNRPLLSGIVSRKEARVLSFVLVFAALVLALSINMYAALVALACIALGIIYSHPRTNFKDTFPYKTIINSAGAGLASIIGGAAVGSISLYLIYSATLAITFLWILGPLGDINDLRGDKLAGKRTLPLVIGVLPTIMMMLAIPPAIAIATLIVHALIGMNMLSVFMTVGVSAGSIYILRPLIAKWNNEHLVKMTRHKMRFMHLLLQLSLLIGLLQF